MVLLRWSWVRDSDPRDPSYKEGAEPLCQPSMEIGEPGRALTSDIGRPWRAVLIALSL